MKHKAGYLITIRVKPRDSSWRSVTATLRIAVYSPSSRVLFEVALCAGDSLDLPVRSTWGTNSFTRQAMRSVTFSAARGYYESLTSTLSSDAPKPFFRTCSARLRTSESRRALTHFHFRLAHCHKPANDCEGPLRASQFLFRTTTTHRPP